MSNAPSPLVVERITVGPEGGFFVVDCPACAGPHLLPVRGEGRLADIAARATHAAPCGAALRLTLVRRPRTVGYGPMHARARIGPPLSPAARRRANRARRSGRARLTDATAGPDVGAVDRIWPDA